MFHFIILTSPRSRSHKNPTRTSIRRGVKSKSKIITLWSAGTKQTAKINGSRKNFLGTTKVRIPKKTVITTVAWLIIIRTRGGVSPKRNSETYISKGICSILGNQGDRLKVKALNLKIMSKIVDTTDVPGKLL